MIDDSVDSDLSLFPSKAILRAIACHINKSDTKRQDHKKKNPKLTRKYLRFSQPMLCPVNANVLRLLLAY